MSTSTPSPQRIASKEWLRKRGLRVKSRVPSWVALSSRAHLVDEQRQHGSASGASIVVGMGKFGYKYRLTNTLPSAGPQMNHFAPIFKVGGDVIPGFTVGDVIQQAQEGVRIDLFLNPIRPEQEIISKSQKKKEKKKRSPKAKKKKKEKRRSNHSPVPTPNRVWLLLSFCRRVDSSARRSPAPSPSPVRI